MDLDNADNPFLDRNQVAEDETNSEFSTDYGYDSDSDLTPLIAGLPSDACDPGPSRRPPTPPPSIGKRKARSDSLPEASRLSKVPRTLQSNIPRNGRNDTLTVPGGAVDLTCQQTMTAMFNKLPIGVQFEITRLVGVGPIKFHDFSPEDLRRLTDEKTNVAAMRKFPSILRSMINDSPNLASEDDAFYKLYGKEIAARSPWEELDKEELALESNNSLALMGFESTGPPSTWYGGKVIFRGILERERSTYRIRLDKPELGPSTHLTRRFGSKNVFRLKLSKQVQVSGGDSMISFVRKPILLCGGVYRAFYAKDMTVFFIRTNETIRNGEVDPANLTAGMAFLDFIRWANPPEINRAQGVTKYCSRFSLLLSSSVPGFLLDEARVCFEPDIIHPETGSNMTDGAGSIGREIMSQMYRQFNWGERPSAIQVRVFGSKGLLVDDKADYDDARLVFLTPSQIKIKYRENDPEPARRVIDVLRSSRLKPSRRIGVEIIVNLAENGVPRQVFTDLLDQTLEDEIKPLLDWDGPDFPARLWKRIEELESVMAARRSREDRVTGRLRGHESYASEDDDLEEGEEETDPYDRLFRHESTAWWPDPVSGSPSSLAETVMDLLLAGFHPKTCPVLAEKLKKLIESKIRIHTRLYRITAPMSCTGTIIPDKRGLLEEGEIFFRSPYPNLPKQNGETSHNITGDVLITRNPCKLPTDVQKCRAVNHPGLQDLVGVIVLSTKGSRRAADMLGGGDYDGDKALVIWEPSIVESFRQQDSRLADPEPGFVEKYFQSTHDISVDSFFSSLAALPVSEQIYRLQDRLLSGLRDISTVGTYSNYHENAIQMLGYHNPETMRLAHMFCNVLDGSKTGLKVKKEIAEADSRRYDYCPRPWKQHIMDDNSKQKANAYNRPTLKRDSRLGPFIMDVLYAHAKKEEGRWLVDLNRFYEANTSQEKDEDLSRPYEELVMKSNLPGGEGYKSDLEKIHEHVPNMYARHQNVVKVNREHSDYSPGTDRSGFTGLAIETRQNRLRALSREFARSPDPAEMHMLRDGVARAKASYAYIYDFQRCRGHDVSWTRFPWNVAFGELCDIKAKALGLTKTVVNDMYLRMYVKSLPGT